jgi:hypothetical protein
MAAALDRWLDRGDPAMSASAVERFWSKVNFDGPIPPLHPDMSPCWLWTGWTRAYEGPNRWGNTPLPYGRFSLPGGKKVTAHRFAFGHAVRPLEDWEQIDHLCHVTLCVNPIHLRATDLSGNASNKSDKARRALATLAVAA